MKSQDVECPYCGVWQEIDHDDGQGYSEDELHQQQCCDCEKTFVFTTGIIYCYNAEKADCLNGAPHEFKQISGAPKEAFIGRFRCIHCDEEEDRDPEGRKVALTKYLNNMNK